MTQLKENEREEIKADCYLLGVKNRCRKVDKHHFHIGYIKLDELNDFKINELTEKARQKIYVNFKSIKKANLNLTYVTLRKEKDYTMESFTMFDERNKAIQFI